MNPVAVLGAVFAGVAASVAWCLTGYFTGYDLPPFAALFVGGFVGFGAVSLDGHGVRMAFLCAPLCVLSVLAGKAGGVYVAMWEARHELAAQLTRERYDAMNLQAPVLGMLPSPEYYKDFMVENGYTEGEDATDEDLERFNAVEVPVLRRLYVEKIEMREWRDLYTRKYLEYSVSSQSAMGIVLSELGLADLLFMSLGVAFTFAMVINARDVRRPNVQKVQKVTRAR